MGSPIRYRLTRTVKPTQLPLSMSEIRRQVAVEDGEQHFDQELLAAANAAVAAVEAETGWVLAPATYRLDLDELPITQPIRMPKPPLIGVASIVIDGQVWDAANFTVEPGTVGRIIPVTSWPGVAADYGGVAITFQAGHGDGAGAIHRDAIDDTLKMAVLELAAHRFRHREGTEIPRGIARLLQNASLGDEFATLWPR